MKTSRRNFNSFLFSASLFSLYPNLLKSSSYGGKYLILIELQGANDGLNTVIPYSNPFYYKLRPNIAIKQEDILTIEKDTGLHFSLKGLAKLFEEGELKIIQNLGYPQPVLSHFRSIELWETGGDGTSKGRDGWLIQSLNHISKKSKLPPYMPPLIEPPSKKCGAAIPWSVPLDPFSFALLPNSEYVIINVSFHTPIFFNDLTKS